MGLGSEFKSKTKKFPTGGEADITEYLKPLGNVPQTVSNVCWITDTPMGTAGDVVGEFLNAVALAGGAVLWGFNRSGGVTLTVMLSGGKATYPFDSNTDLFASLGQLTEMVLDYCQNKLPARYKAAEQAGRL